MKNIAILVYNVINDYYCNVIDGIISYLENKNDIRIVVAPVCVPGDTSSDFDYQNWSSVEVLKSKEIDGIILITNSFMEKINLEKLSKELSDFSSKPVISVSTPINIKNSKYTCNVPDKSYEKVIEHLKNKHGRRKFAFLSASLLDSVESEERLNAFKKALKKNELEFNPDLVFPGDFTPGRAKDELLARYKSKEAVDFDAIICVNDFSAGGCILALQELGLHCPEDVSIIGFDNVPFCLLTYPTISSIDQNIHETGIKVGELMYKMVNGEDIETRTALQCSPVYRQSCGCVNWKVHSNAFYDDKDTYHEIDEFSKVKEQNALFKSISTTENLHKLLNLMDTEISMNQLPEVIHKAIHLTNIRSAAACFYQKQLLLGPDDKFVLPESSRVLLYANSENHVIKIFTEENGPVYNPHDLIIPEALNFKTAGVYYMLPISLRKTNYGYLVCRINKEDISLTAVHLKILTNILIHAYEYTRQEADKIKLLDMNNNLNFQSKTDELTQIYNRRGFFEYGKQLIDLSAARGKFGLVFFCDLDGLKKINDTYGHKIGDLAIQTEAKVLKKAFRDSDLVGRLSGDEFGVIAPGFPLRKVDILRQRLIELNDQLSKEANLPFTLSISIGPIEYTEHELDLAKLLTQADKNLYEEKKIKHGIKKD